MPRWLLGAVVMVVVTVLALAAGCQRPEPGGAPPAKPAGAGPAAKAPAEPGAAEKYVFVFRADCRWLEEVAVREMNSAIAQNPDIDVVYGHNDPSAHGAFVAAEHAGGDLAQRIKFIGIDALPHEGVRYVREGVLAATFEYKTGGPEAINAAVRILGGEQVPHNISLGTRVITAENVDEGGEYVPPDVKEGWENADSLDRTPLRSLGDRKFTIGMSQCNREEPWRVQMDADIKAAADEHPQLNVLFKNAQNDEKIQQSHVREFIDQKVDLIIISPKEAIPLTAPVEEAMDAGIPVIVLDRKIASDKYTCFIGGDNVMIGREAGKWVKRTFPDGAKIVELQGLMTSTPAVERHQGFLEGLGIQAQSADAKETGGTSGQKQAPQ